MLLLIISLFTSNFLFSDSNIVLTVTGIDDTIGIIRVGLYDNEKDFMYRSIAGKNITVEEKEIQLVFENIPEGNYAISLYHDQNANGKLDSNFLRIPKEPYGFSNNPSTTFGPPDFEEASFTHQVNSISHIKIELK